MPASRGDFMRKVLGLSISAAAIVATGLIPTAGWAATAASAAVTANTPGGDPNTTVTFTVTSGLLTMTAPDSVNLLPTGSDTGLPGTTVSATMGTTTVTDDRALLGATWTATAAESDFKTGAGTTDETIPATDASFDPGTITTTGIFLSAPVVTPVTLANGPQTIVTGSADGDNIASWDAAVAVAIPSTAVLGTYTGTLTQSVS